MIALPFIYIFAVFGGALFLAGLAVGRWNRGMRRWQTASARVVATEIAERTESDRWDWYTVFIPTIHYSFEVGGVTFQGSRYRIPGMVRTLLREQAKQMLAHYPVGKEITVRYDPHKPARCAIDIEDALDGSAAAFLLLSGTTLLLAALLIRCSLHEV
jgi:hypothetical protein